MKNSLTKLPEIADIKPRSIRTTMYDNSMENFTDLEDAKLSILELSRVIAQQVKFSDIINGKAYVIELHSGEIYINNVESDGKSLELSSLNPQFHNMKINLNQVKNVYQIYRVDTDRQHR